MKIAVCGPIDTDLLRQRLGLKLDGAPAGMPGIAANIEIIELRRRGFFVTAVTQDPSIDTPSRFDEGGLQLRFVPRRPRARHRALDFFRREIKYMAQELKDAEPDVVHAHWSYEFAMAGLRAGLPLVISCRDSPCDIFFQFGDPYRFVRLLMALTVFRRGQVFAAVSPYVQGRINWMLKGRCTVVPNGVDESSIRRCPRTAIRRANPVLVTVGDSTRRKNVAAALKAFALIRREIPTAEFHLFGPGLTATDPGSADGVHPHGSRPYAEVQAFLNEKADLMIHPSLEEAFGWAIIEGMAAGLPVIAGSRAGGPPYVLGENMRQCLVDMRDPVAIASTAIHILKDQGLYAHLASQVIENVRERFTAQRMVDEFLSILEQAATEKNPKQEVLE